MPVLTPSRVIAAVALGLAALSFGAASAGTGGNAGVAKATKKPCVHGTAPLERNRQNVVAYYTRAFNDKGVAGGLRRAPWSGTDADDGRVALGLDPLARPSCGRACPGPEPSHAHSPSADTPRDSGRSPSSWCVL